MINSLNRFNFAGANVIAVAAALVFSFSSSAAFAEDAMSKAVVLFQKKDYQTAAQSFRALADSKQGATAHYYLGLCYIQLGHQPHATAIFERLCQIWPESSEAKLAAKYLNSASSSSGSTEQGLSDNTKAMLALAAKRAADTNGYGAPLTRAEWEKLPAKTRIPIERVGGHLWVQVKINGQYCRMAFDTGATLCTVSVVDYPNVVSPSELRNAKILRVGRVYGEVDTRCTETEISIQDITRRLDTCFINEKGCNVIGQNFFKEYSYQVDDFYIRLTKAPFAGDLPKVAAALPISAARASLLKQNDKFTLPYELDGGTMLVNITVNGHPIKARFDTGCGAEGLVIHPSMNQYLEIKRAGRNLGVADRIEVGHITKMAVQVLYEVGLSYPLIGPKVFNRGYTVDPQAKVIRFDY